jgi:hypothetical protein
MSERSSEMKNQFEGDASNSTRRRFIAGMTGVIAATAIPVRGNQTSQRQVTAEDPGIAFVLSTAERERAAALLAQVFTPFMGEWIGTREGRDTGSRSAVFSRQHYSLYLGGPHVVAEVEAVVEGVEVFRAAKHYTPNPVADTLLTYFFENGGDVQIFRLDRSSLDQGKLVWNEILRKGRLFRVEESIPKNDEWSATVFQQDERGRYQVFATNILRRKWREAYRRRGQR